jgi:hypothetical protein
LGREPHQHCRFDAHSLRSQTPLHPGHFRRDLLQSATGTTTSSQRWMFSDPWRTMGRPTCGALRAHRLNNHCRIFQSTITPQSIHDPGVTNTHMLYYVPLLMDGSRARYNHINHIMCNKSWPGPCVFLCLFCGGVSVLVRAAYYLMISLTAFSLLMFFRRFLYSPTFVLLVCLLICPLPTMSVCLIVCLYACMLAGVLT